MVILIYLNGNLSNSVWIGGFENKSNLKARALLWLDL